MTKLFTGIALVALFATGQVAAQQVATGSPPPPAPSASDDDYGGLGLTGLGDNAPIVLTGIAGIALIGGIILLDDDDNDSTSATGTTAPAAGNASDLRLKQDVRYLGTLENGLRIHAWRYVGGETDFTGVIAQELLEDNRFAGAVTVGEDGFYRVDYRALGIAVPEAAAMRREGDAALEAASL